MENRYITVQYKLYAPMGAEKQIELIEETRPDMPFQFISGMGMVLEALENHLHPLQAGEAFKITLSGPGRFSLLVGKGQQIHALLQSQLPVELAEGGTHF